MAVVKIPTVSNFLCYFELRTGGLFVAFMETAVYGLTLLFLIVNLLTGMSIIAVDTLNKFSVLGENEHRRGGSGTKKKI